MASEAELLGRIAELEEELRTQRGQADTTSSILELVVRQLPAIYWIVDRDLRLLRTGGEVKQILGYDQNRYVGRTLHEALADDASTGDTIVKHTRACAGETIHYESEYRAKHLATVIGPYRNAEGEIVGAVGTCIDVTTWRMLERRMVDAQRAESIGVLAGGLAHDFNNLLVAVLGNADLALREIDLLVHVRDLQLRLADGRAARAPIENIRTAGLRAAELIEQLLAYAGRGGIGDTRIEPGLVVEELLRIIAPSIPSEVKIVVDIPTRLAVRGDTAQFRQVLINLINNARDVLIGRGGEISVRAAPSQETGAPHPHDALSAPAGSYVVIEVEDDGPGMDSETRRHVFEPFFTTKLRGHGIGLAAVLGIVRAHGGGIRVISAPGTGTKFQVLWPAAVSVHDRAASQPTAARTVLVIDDEDLVRDVVARMVEDLGYAAVTAADGKTGLELVERQSVDAVLVDLTMPQMSGADVVAALRKRHPGVPIVLCSGFDRDGRGPIQADAYLPKPFRIDALEATLAKLLPLRSV